MPPSSIATASSAAGSRRNARASSSARRPAPIPALRSGRDSPGSAFALNELDERHLTAHGYLVLRHSDEIGVDLFVKEEESLLVFLQGHRSMTRTASLANIAGSRAASSTAPAAIIRMSPRTISRRPASPGCRPSRKRRGASAIPRSFPPSRACELPASARLGRPARCGSSETGCARVAARRVTKPIRVFA